MSQIRNFTRGRVTIQWVDGPDGPVHGLYLAGTLRVILPDDVARDLVECLKESLEQDRSQNLADAYADAKAMPNWPE